MKMVKALIRPETADKVVDGLSEAGFVSLTKVMAFGRGKQKGLDAGTAHYDELPKTMLIYVVEDGQVEEVLGLTQKLAYTGNFGDGKVFVSDVERVLTIRTGADGL
jgi:nitrogen regulatory protein PII 1